MKRPITYVISGLTVVVLMLLTACQRQEPKDELYTFYTEVTNETLRREIIAYHDGVLAEENAKRIAQGDSIYVSVCFRVLNDSMTRYSMEYIIDLDIVDDCPVIVTSVGGHPVFFSAAGGYRFFGMPKKKKGALLKRYFPKLYAEEVRQRELEAKNMPVPIRAILMHPTIYHLTFLRDSLIDKQYQPGCSGDEVEIEINGKKVWM